MGGEPQERGGIALATASGGENAFVVGDGAAAGWGGNGARLESGVLWSRTWSSLAAAAWSLSSSSGQNPVWLCRAVTSKEEVGRYRELLAQAAHIEGRLVVVLGTFPLPDLVFAAAAGEDDCGNTHCPVAVNVIVVPGDGIIVAEGGVPSPPPPAWDDNHGTSPHNEAIWLEEESCGGGAILSDPTSS